MNWCRNWRFACGFLFFSLWAATTIATANPSPSPTAAGSAQSDEWRRLIERYIQRQASGSGLRIRVDIPMDEAGPPACGKTPRFVEVQRTRWIGPQNIGLQCDTPAWRWSVNVRVRGFGQVVQTSRAVPAGQLLGPDDILQVESDLATEPTGVLTDPAQAVGRETTRPMRENTSLTLNTLRVPAVINVGDRITVRVVGKAFQVTADGVALQKGAVGDTIRVKLSEGKTVSASVVRAGHVDVTL